MDFDGKTEDQDALEKFTLQEVLEELKKVKDVYPSKHGGKRKRKRGEEPMIYNRKSAWWGLPYWKDMLVPHNHDVMHIEKNICENILWTLLKVEGKTKDTTNAVLDLHDMKIRHQYHGI